MQWNRCPKTHLSRHVLGGTLPGHCPKQSDLTLNLAEGQKVLGRRLSDLQRFLSKDSILDFTCSSSSGILQMSRQAALCGSVIKIRLLARLEK